MSPKQQKYLGIDRGSFVGTIDVAFTRWRHTNFYVGNLRRQRKTWFSPTFGFPFLLVFESSQFIEILVNRLSRKKLSGSGPASKSLRATMLSSDLYRQLSNEDKKVWKQLSSLAHQNVPYHDNHMNVVASRRNLLPLLLPAGRYRNA